MWFGINFDGHSIQQRIFGGVTICLIFDPGPTTTISPCICYGLLLFLVFCHNFDSLDDDRVEIELLAMLMLNFTKNLHRNSLYGDTFGDESTYLSTPIFEKIPLSCHNFSAMFPLLISLLNSKIEMRAWCLNGIDVYYPILCRHCCKSYASDSIILIASFTLVSRSLPSFNNDSWDFTMFPSLSTTPLMTPLSY